MKRPILAYGHQILKQQCRVIKKNHSGLDILVSDMWETMRNANGSGLAAPQIGFPLSLFIVDSKSTYEHLDQVDKPFYFEKEDHGIKETFINATIIDRSLDEWDEEEGCLSIPGLYSKVKRSWTITIEYYDLNFKKNTRTFSGLTARIIQHEYDHIQGILYLDHLSPFIKKLMAVKLQKILKGKIDLNYPMVFI